MLPRYAAALRWLLLMLLPPAAAFRRHYDATVALYDTMPLLIVTMAAVDSWHIIFSRHIRRYYACLPLRHIIIDAITDGGERFAADANMLLLRYAAILHTP